MKDGALHEDLIAFLVARLRPQRYLELGVGYNETLQKVRRVYGGQMLAVDIARPMTMVPMVKYFIKSTQDFIREDAKGYAPYDMVFIDADHNKEAVREDFDGIWPYVSDDGLVLLHDMNPATVADTVPGLCGDSWITGQAISKKHESVVLPFHPGLQIVRKRVRWGPE